MDTVTKLLSCGRVDGVKFKFNLYAESAPSARPPKAFHCASKNPFINESRKLFVNGPA